MAEVRIRTDASNLQRGIQVTTREAKKLTTALTRTKAPLLHPAETRKAIQVNQRFSRGLRQTSSSYNQVNRSAKQMLQIQQSIVESQKQMLKQMEQMARMQQRGGGGAGGHGGGGGGRGIPGQGTGNQPFKKAAEPFKAISDAVKGIGGIVGSILAPLAVSSSFLASLGSRGTVPAMERQFASMMLRQTTGTGQSFGRLGASGVGLGFSRAQTFQMARMQAMSMGGFSTGNTLQTMQMQRAYGLDPGTLLSLQQATRMSGTAGNQNAQTINRALVQGLRSGQFSTALMNEFAQSVTGIFSTMQDRAVRVNARVISGIVGTASRQMGGQFARSPSTTGRLLTRADAAMRGGKGAGQAMMLSSLMNQGLNYGQAVERLQEGLFSGNNFSTFLRVSRQFGGGAMGRVMAGQAFGMSPLDLRALQRIDPASVTARRAMQAGVRTDAQGRPIEPMRMISTRARQAVGQISLQARQIRTQEEFATLRLRMDPAYAAANNLLILGIKGLSGTFEKYMPKLISALKMVGGGFN